MLGSSSPCKKEFQITENPDVYDGGFRFNIQRLGKNDHWEPPTIPAEFAKGPTEDRRFGCQAAVNLSMEGSEMLGESPTWCNHRMGDALEPSVFVANKRNGSMWMIYGSHKLSHSEEQGGLWMVQLDPATGRCALAARTPFSFLVG